MTPEESRRARAAARATMPIRRVSLRDEGATDVSHLDPSARIALVWQVTLDAWASSGLPMPDYERANAPGRMLRGRHGET